MRISLKDYQIIHFWNNKVGQREDSEDDHDEEEIRAPFSF